MLTTKYDTVIVLGGGVGERGELSDLQKARLDGATKLYNDGQVRSIITSGAYGYATNDTSQLTEARAMRDYLVSKGVPVQKIYMEEESKDTVGNAYFCKTRILLPKNWHNICIIPAMNHMYERVAYIFDKVLGADYIFTIIKYTDNSDAENLEREQRSYSLIQSWLDNIDDGDHEAIYKMLLQKHPAYGQDTEFTEEQLQELLG